MASLLEFCRRYGLKTPDDYVLWPPFGAVVSEKGEAKLKAAAAQDPALLKAMFDASGEVVEAVLAGERSLSKHTRKRLERTRRFAR